MSKVMTIIITMDNDNNQCPIINDDKHNIILQFYLWQFIKTKVGKYVWVKEKKKNVESVADSSR